MKLEAEQVLCRILLSTAIRHHGESPYQAVRIIK
jgi:hypothetical protein